MAVVGHHGLPVQSWRTSFQLWRLTFLNCNVKAELWPSRVDLSFKKVKARYVMFMIDWQFLFHNNKRLFANYNDIVCVTFVLSLLSQALQYYFLTFLFFFVTFPHLLLHIAGDLVIWQIFCLGFDSWFNCKWCHWSWNSALLVFFHFLGGACNPYWSSEKPFFQR